MNDDHATHSTNRIPVVGIDFGTGSSAIARMNEMGQAEVIRIAGLERIPSAVFLSQNGEAVAGRQAFAVAESIAGSLVQSVKCSLGEERTWQIHGTDYSSRQVAAEILKRLLFEAESLYATAVREAVITFPVWFTAEARRELEAAGKLAGLEQVHLVDELTAAALAYGVNHFAEGDLFLVYGLGETFACSLMRRDADRLTVLASTGRRELGGRAWTEILVEKVAERLADQFGEAVRSDAAAKLQLHLRCEDAKRGLAVADRQTIYLEHNGHIGRVVITRDEFDGWIDGSLQETLLHAERIVQEAGKQWQHVSRVLLVGGSTQWPRVSAAWGQLTVHQPITLDEGIIARGAALVATQVFSAKEAPARPGEPSRSPAPRIDENVQFTVYRPKTVRPMKWHPLLAFAHLDLLGKSIARDS